MLTPSHRLRNRQSQHTCPGGHKHTYICVHIGSNWLTRTVNHFLGNVWSTGEARSNVGDVRVVDIWSTLDGPQKL